MEDLFKLEAPISAPRFRSVVACLRLFFRPAGFFSLRGTAARAAYATFPSLFFLSPASHWLGCISRGARAPYRSYGPRQNSAEPPHGTLAKLGHPRPHGPRPTACGVRLEFGEIISLPEKIKPQTTSRHRPGAPPRTARAHRSAIVARRSSIADRRSAVGLGLVRSFGRGQGWLRHVVVCACVYTT